MDTDAIWEGLGLLATAGPFAFLVIGLVGGFLVGVLPGFEATNAAALALPFTLAVPAESGLILMAAVYAGAMFAGAVPAILVNVPGTAGAAATAIDGYPMAMQGKGIEAISIARVASAAGGILSAAFVLVLMAPMSSLALEFASPETFLAAALGLFVIGSVLGAAIWKGLLSALLGLLIASMSASPISGRPRMTFGLPELYESVPFVPVVVGMFAVSEMFLLSRGSARTALSLPLVQSLGAGTFRRAVADMVRRSTRGMTHAFRYPATLLRSAAIGLGIGVLPGLGVGIANWISYGVAKKRSPRRDNFGKGEPEGIVASEACDNAVVSGSLVPTFALGIPGSATAAIMLAALYMHGIAPGPRLMVTHGPEVYSVLWSVLIASALIVPIGIALAAPLTYITRVSAKYLVPVILVLALVGSFALRGLVFDMLLTVLFGIVAVGMRLRGFPVVPLVIALVLSPILEGNLLRSLALSNGDLAIFFESGWSKALWAIFFVLLVSKVVSWLRGRSRRSAGSEPDDEVDVGGRQPPAAAAGHGSQASAAPPSVRRE